MSKLTDKQQRAIDSLKKALAEHASKNTETSKALVMKHYDAALRHTLSAEHLTKEEQKALAAITAE